MTRFTATVAAVAMLASSIAAAQETGMVERTLRLHFDNFMKTDGGPT